MFKDLTEIAMALIGLALIGLLITRSKDTRRVIKAGTEGFGGLLRVATFQGQGNSFGGFNFDM